LLNEKGVQAHVEEIVEMEDFKKNFVIVSFDTEDEAKDFVSKC